MITSYESISLKEQFRRNMDSLQFVKEHIRYKQHWNKKVGMTDALWQPLSEDTWINGIMYAAGSEFKVFETRNFGWIVFKPGTLDGHGNLVSRRIVKV
jgi:hypothetical protein